MADIGNGGLGNGSLLKPVVRILERVGMLIDTETRQAWQTIGRQSERRIFVSRPQHVVGYLRAGLVKWALVGWDMLEEYSDDNDRFISLQQFAISKSSLERSARVVLFVSATAKVVDPRAVDWPCLSEYQRVARLYFKQIFGLAWKPGNTVVPSAGGTEAPVADGLYGCGIGVVDSGRSLKANQVREIATVLEAPVILAIRADLPAKERAAVEQMGKQMAAALEQLRKEEKSETRFSSGN